MVLFQRVAPPALAAHVPRERPPGLGKLDQVVDRRQQLSVVPRLGQVVGGARLHQVDGGLQVGPSREQDHRQVRMPFADPFEQRDPFLARRGVGAEIHVLHDEVDGLTRGRTRLQRGQPVLG